MMFSLYLAACAGVAVAYIIHGIYKSDFVAVLREDAEKRRKKREYIPTAVDVMVDLLVLRIAAIPANEEYLEKSGDSHWYIHINQDTLIKTVAYSQWPKYEKYESAANQFSVEVIGPTGPIGLSQEQRGRLGDEIGRYHHRCVRLQMNNQEAANANKALDIVESLI